MVRVDILVLFLILEEMLSAFHTEYGVTYRFVVYGLYYVEISSLQMEIPKWLSDKEFTCQCKRCGFNPWVRKIPWRRKRQPTPVFLLGESHGQRSLVGYSP